MLRTRTPVRPLTLGDRDDALAVCALDPARHVFVAARMLDSWDGSTGAVLGYRDEGRLTSLVWTLANIVPAGTSEADRPAYAERLRRARGRCASLLGPRDEVLGLWGLLAPTWGEPRAVRRSQPLMVTTTPPSQLRVPLDPRVRPARERDLDALLPAAAHMFTHEIGYPPYTGSSRGYRWSLAAMVRRGHTFVVVERDEVVFKADIGSLALGYAQLQGVWLTPRWRGQGLATAMMAATVEQVFALGVRGVCLYVNDFNHAARAVYESVGLVTVDEFATVLL